MDEIKKSYYAIIPASVRYDERVMANAKLLYGEITALCNEKGYCWAGDKYFADLYKVSKTTVQNWLRSLTDTGYISKEVVYKEGTKEILARYIRIVAYPTQENLHTPIQENLRENNTSFNNTSNNTLNKKEKGTGQAPNSLIFEGLWKLYPKKNLKKDAKAAFDRAIKKGTTPKEIEDGIKRYLAYLEENKWQAPMDGGRWFQKERWGDEYEVKKNERRRYEDEYAGFF